MILGCLTKSYKQIDRSLQTEIFVSKFDSQPDFE